MPAIFSLVLILVFVLHIVLFQGCIMATILLCAPGMAHGAQAPFTGLWWSGGDSGVLVF